MPTVVMSKDVSGGKDHPVVSRYAGSSIVRYTTQKFTDYRLLNSKITRSPGYGGKIDDANSIGLEGKLTRISYELAVGRSTLEVFRNYEIELQKAGFESIFTCNNQECGGREFNLTVVPYWAGFAGSEGDQRYLAAKLEGAESNIYLALYVVRNYSAGGPTQNRIYTQLDIIETKPMDTGMVKVDADAMAQEIGKLMTNHADLKIVVVGHTDNIGKFDYNMGLSKRRAAAVEQALVQQQGIAAERLKSWGVGFLSPVASNQTDEGRAKNRRVELVEQ
jgi:OOP family OmpA-OmpF porin